MVSPDPEMNPTVLGTPRPLSVDFFSSYNISNLTSSLDNNQFICILFLVYYYIRIKNKIKYLMPIRLGYRLS